MTSRQAFTPVPAELDFPKYEQRILELWKREGIFEKSLIPKSPDARKFVFYEGPPTANGVPHNGHVLTRVMKDLFPRYRSMNGDQVLRKGGWDTHGLPVEVEVEKELRIHGKAAIEEYGVRPFVSRCIDSVFRYTAEWERLTERIGFWVSLDDAYVTYHRSYVESVWWALAELFQKGLLTQGHKVVWWWAQGGTALSAAEVGLGYKEVDDPSVYLVFPLKDEPETGLVVWTTTPWTLPSNAYAAVRANTSYDVVRIGEVPAAPEAEAAGNGKGKAGKAADAGGKPLAPLTLGVKQLILASDLRESVAKKLGRPLEVVRTVRGSELVGQCYVPPFDVYSKTLGATSVALKAGGDTAQYWRVIAEDFVTLDTGSGIVHIAPAFGEDDNKAHMKELSRYADPSAVELLCAVNPDGSFKANLGKYAGRWVKECDKEILKELSERGLLVHEELYRHDYPFCWRSDDDPLIQMARPAWFIRTTQKIDQALANNQAVNWVPEHIKEGRFGDFLRNNVDWALSRERFWGTPLNIWCCSACEAKHAPSSVAEIEQRNPKAFDHFHEARRQDPTLSEHLIVHKPWIDQVVFPCPSCGAEMHRVTEVIDCWFDSGCMPFAQWGFPHLPGSKEQFDGAFPADFISEAIDQTRGWFYSLMMVSSLLFDGETQERLGLSRMRSFPHPYQTCIVLGHVCDREGKKESKQKGNYTPPEIILDRVRMEFGVLDSVAGITVAPGEALIGREDLDGMDLNEGAEVAIYRGDRPEQIQRLTLKTHKKLPRRVILLPEAVQAEFGLQAAKNGLTTLPREVPGLPVDQRVMVEDPNTPAPGADAFRWFFYASSPPWSNTRHSLRNVRQFQKDFQVKLRNVYSFFVIYANIDGWQPELEARARPAAERCVLDRWMLSELALTIQEVRRGLDGYMAYDAASRLVELVEALSNWYVRRSRSRFWASVEADGSLDQEKLDAYATLYRALVTLCQLTAPFIPFFAEEMYQNLVRVPGGAEVRESVHLSDFPVAEVGHVDQKLAEEMAAVREIVSLGLSVRTSNKLKVRQPLSRADVVFNDGALLGRLDAYREPILEELNVHEIRFMHPGHEQGAVAFRLKPNFRALGPRLGKDVQAVKQALAAADGSQLHAELSRFGFLTLTVSGAEMKFTREEIDVQVEAAEGFAAETGRTGVVVIHTTLTEELIDEGLLREIASRVQAARKEAGLEFTDRVTLSLGGTERILRVARAGAAHLQSECLAREIRFEEGSESHKEIEIGGERLVLGLQKS